MYVVIFPIFYMFLFILAWFSVALIVVVWVVCISALPYRCCIGFLLTIMSLFFFFVPWVTWECICILIIALIMLLFCSLATWECLCLVHYVFVWLFFLLLMYK